LTPLGVALALIAVALADGGYAPGVVAGIGLICAWALCLALALRLIPRGEIPRPAAVGGVAMAGLASFSFVSLGWATDDGAAFADGVLAAVYALVFLLVVLLSRRSSAREWLLGLTLGLAGICLLALASRWFPGLASDEELSTFLPGVIDRLAYPIGYWNGLGAALALLICLLGWNAVRAPSPAWRSLATGLLPLAMLGLFLTSSRGGVLAAIVGLAVLTAALEKRSLLLGSMALAAPGAALLVFVANGQADLLDGLQTADADRQGIVLLLVSLGTVAVTTAVRRTLDRPLSEVSVPTVVGRVCAAAALAVVVAAIVVAGPGKRVDDFKASPDAAEASQSVVGSHLTSGSGSGRYQFWEAAIDAFQEKPVAGIGAGGYEAWWNQHGSIRFNVQNAHSLFLETMAELGVVGLALLVAFFAVALLSGLARLRSDARGEVAAALALVAAGMSSAAIDWSWEIPAVFGTVVVAAGLLTGPATLSGQGSSAALLGPPARSVRLVAASTAAVALVACAIALLAQLQLDSSQDAARAGDLDGAARDARAAAKIEPWAAAPALQLALVSERAGDLKGALRAIDDATERDRENWQIWLVAARLNLKAGDVPAAERALARSRQLNPRSAVFRSQPGPG
jgi:hypothetical protein